MLRSPITCTVVLSSLVLALHGPQELHAQQAGASEQPRAGGASVQAGGRPPSIPERTADMQKFDGYFPVYWEERAGTLWLEIPRFDTDFLFTTGLAAGLGSNDIGLDRGQGGGGRLVSFQRAGPKVFLVQANESFRSSSVNPDERRSVADSFATSVLWGFTVAAESNGHVLVDATDFFLRDGHNASTALHPGIYRLDRTRCSIYLPRTKAFPKNTEVEITLTFTTELASGRGEGGRRHSRHTFAVRALESSPTGRQRIGQHMLALATYMGHVNINATYWYLETTPELLRDIAVVTENFVQGERP